MAAKKTQLVRGIKTTEFWMSLSTKILGAVLVLAALLGDGDPQQSLYVMAIGGAMLVGVDGLYGLSRAKAKAAAMAVLVLALGLLAAPAMAGALNVAAPQAVTSSPTPPARAQAQPSAREEGWNEVKQILGLKTDGQPLNPGQIKAILAALNKLSQQNAQLKADMDAARAKAQVFGVSGGASQVDALMAALTQRVNQQAVLNGMARNAYGAPGQALYGAPGYAPAGLTMTAADVRQAVKDELKANQTWFDEMPWYVRVPLAIGTLAILNDLGITLPGL